MFFLLYGLLCYAAFIGTIAVAVCFLADFGLPVTLDHGPIAPLSQALPIDLMLLMMFALQHSMMARPTFKKVWTRVVPPVIERSTYVLAASLAMLVLLLEWRPLMYSLWDVKGHAGRAVLTAICVGGFAFTLYASFLINHFELFGLRQVWLHFKGRPYEVPKFSTSVVYKYVRAPLMLGFLISFWVSPTMTIGRVLLASVATIYVVIAVRWEERDLAVTMGEDYVRYRDSTPMLIPRWPFGRGARAKGDPMCESTAR